VSPGVPNPRAAARIGTVAHLSAEQITTVVRLD
jgi:hypothetical protein